MHSSFPSRLSEILVVHTYEFKMCVPQLQTMRKECLQFMFSQSVIQTMKAVKNIFQNFTTEVQKCFVGPVIGISYIFH